MKVISGLCSSRGLSLGAGDPARAAAPSGPQGSFPGGLPSPCPPPHPVGSPAHPQALLAAQPWVQRSPPTLLQSPAFPCLSGSVLVSILAAGLCVLWKKPSRCLSVQISCPGAGFGFCSPVSGCLGPGALVRDISLRLREMEGPFPSSRAVVARSTKWLGTEVHGKAAASCCSVTFEEQGGVFTRLEPLAAGTFVLRFPQLVALHHATYCLALVPSQ